MKETTTFLDRHLEMRAYGWVHSTELGQNVPPETDLRYTAHFKRGNK